MSSNTDESLKLVIRTANNKHADFELELSPSATIYELKRKITVNHPTKPTPRDQRLIFAGKLLDDGSALNQVFVKATTGSTPMVHLVLDSDKTATSPKPPQQSTPRPSEQPVPFEQPIPCSHSSTYEQYSEQLNKYQQQLHQFVADPYGSPPVPSYETQAYLQYCYTHYQMYQNLLAYQRTTVLPSAPANFTAAPAAAPAGEAPSGAPPPAAAAQPAAGNNNNNNNEVEQENDLLGVLNMLVELFVLCSIIYFYSTFSRFILVFVFFVFLYLHCRGYLSLQRRRPVPPARPAPVVPEQAPENDAEDDAEADAPANEAPNQNDVPRPRPVPPTQAPGAEPDVQISAPRLLMTAVSTFFSSLIPERPQRA